MVEQGQTWANDTQKFQITGFTPAGDVLLFGLTHVDYLNLDDHGRREIPVDVLESFLQKEMNDFKLVPKA